MLTKGNLTEVISLKLSKHERAQLDKLRKEYSTTLRVFIREIVIIPFLEKAK